MKTLQQIRGAILIRALYPFLIKSSENILLFFYREDATSKFKLIGKWGKDSSL